MNRIFCPALFLAAILGVSQTSHAAFLQYFATLNGPSESPANNSPGVGTALVDVDSILNTMRVRVTFNGLTANATNAHIHAATAVPGVGTAGVATTTPTFAGFPLGVTAGTYDQTLDLTLGDLLET